MPREEYVVAAGQGPGANEFDRTHDLRVHRLPLTLKAWGIRSLKGIVAGGKDVDISTNIAAEYRHKAGNLAAIVLAYERLHPEEG